MTKEGLILIEGWARDGLTDVQIAKKIGISKQTFYDWQKRYPDFSDPLKKGKEIVDRQVENALLKKALGYSYKECTEITDAEGNVSTKIITKYVIPDTTAQIFWLKNRKPNEWREKQEVKQINIEPKQDNLSQLTDEELRQLISLGGTE